MKILKLIGNIVGGICGVILIIAVIVMWLGFFGIIPQGQVSEDRYADEVYAPFNP
jgi:hypothetical protein